MPRIDVFYRYHKLYCYDLRDYVVSGRLYSKYGDGSISIFGTYFKIRYDVNFTLCQEPQIIPHCNSKMLIKVWRF